MHASSTFIISICRFLFCLFFATASSFLTDLRRQILSQADKVAMQSGPASIPPPPPAPAFQNNFQGHCSTVEDDGGGLTAVSMVASEQCSVFGALDQVMLLNLSFDMGTIGSNTNRRKHIHHATEVLKTGLSSTIFPPKMDLAFRDFVSEVYGSDITPSLLHTLLVQQIIGFDTNPLLVTKSSLTSGEMSMQNTPMRKSFTANKR